jgi:flagellar hook-basal body complex protein FliE
MTGLEAIAPLALGSSPAISQLGLAGTAATSAPAGTGFADLLAQGMRTAETKVAHANDLVRQFAIDDSIPLHQVTYALEEARLAVELTMQVRTKLIESYRELMNMQL